MCVCVASMVSPRFFFAAMPYVVWVLKSICWQCDAFAWWKTGWNWLSPGFFFISKMQVRSFCALPRSNPLAMEALRLKVAAIQAR